jgi:hypothetical protein
MLRQVLLGSAGLVGVGSLCRARADRAVRVLATRTEESRDSAFLAARWYSILATICGSAGLALATIVVAVVLWTRLTGRP